MRITNFRTHASLPSPSPAGPSSAAPAAVIDTLRATTSMCAALAAGCDGIAAYGSPTDVEAALDADGGRWRRERAAGRAAVCGEQGGRMVDWFDLGNSPAMFTPEAVGGKRLLMVTTNGTVALGKCAQLTSGPILAACLLNAKAVAEMLLAGGRGGSAPDEVWLVCAGSVGKEAAEDTLTAGLVALHLSEVHPGCAPDAETERAMGMVRDIRRNGESWTGVGRRMENARALSELGEHFMQDVEYCFGGVGPAVDGLEVVGVLDRQTGLVVRAGTSREAMPDRC